MCWDRNAHDELMLKAKALLDSITTSEENIWLRELNNFELNPIPVTRLLDHCRPGNGNRRERIRVKDKISDTLL